MHKEIEQPNNEPNHHRLPIEDLEQIIFERLKLLNKNKLPDLLMAKGLNFVLENIKKLKENCPKYSSVKYDFTSKAIAEDAQNDKAAAIRETEQSSSNTFKYKW